MAVSNIMTAVGTGTTKKQTPKMRNIEKKYGKPLVELLPDMINESTMSEVADELGVSKATLGYWMLKLDIIVRRVALRPGETVTISRAPSVRADAAD